MDQLTVLVEMVRAHPMLAGAGAVVVGIVSALLQRRPRLQREADERLSVLRRDNADQYTKLRPPR